ncbi:sensor histidine kinase [Herbidospora mongoliensis]|uniref:sensor histidine kinase n=1 Tax=Herbidospora mongoliensis TaxID=688067 RepID=UPI0008324139|nr:sensor histidine kinase [Herbidospora mongoliensis]
MLPSLSRRTVAALSIAAFCLVAAVLAAWAEILTGAVTRPGPISFSSWSSTVPGVALAVAGAVLALRLPRHAVTWILLAGGLTTALNGLGAAYAGYSITHHGGALPLTAPAFYAGARLGPFMNLVPVLVLLFFPDGRLPSARWRRPAWLSLGGTGFAVLVFLAVPWHIVEPGEEWPGLDVAFVRLPDEVWRVLFGVAPVLIAVTLVVSVAAFVARFRGADRVRRAQLRWMLLAGLLNVVLLAAPLVADWLPDDAVFVAAIVALAAAVLIAVGRYRLYDIDPVLGWTLVYGALAAAVVGIDVTIFAGMSALVEEPAAAVLAAGVVAVLYGPLRTWIQKKVGGVLRGEPYDVVSALARRLEESAGPEELLLAVATAVASAFRSPFVRVELDRPSGGVVAVEHGTRRDDGVVVLPFAYRDVEIGRLTLVPRAGTRLAEADQRLLADVVRQAAAAVRATALTEELQQSRERLVGGVEEERRRLRRDLHDGLGPTLAAAALKVEAAGNLMDRDPALAREALGQVRGDLSTVLNDVRRLVHDLRPPALDQFGLAGALRQAAERFGEGTVAIVVSTAGDLTGLPAAAEVAAYRIGCEAMVNVTRHARAARCEVRLTATGGTLEVEIVDDGRGLRTGEGVGVGLLAMRERAEELGGRCTVTGGATGTRVHAVLPLAVPA